MDETQPKQKQDDTGHEWDGIRELRNDPPRWWMVTFRLVPLWLLMYFLLYPAIPLLAGHTRGLLGWTSIGEYRQSQKEVEAVRAPFEKKIAAMSPAEILNDPQLANYAVASVRQTFGDNCAACHGSGGQGSMNAPILVDDDWLYGGTIDKIYESISGGRQGLMPAFKGRFSDRELKDLMQFLVELPKGKVHEPGQKVFLGRTPAGVECAGCHGESAMGIHEVGSTNLTDAICRFECTPEGLQRTVLHGVNDETDPETRKTIMPVWSKKLTDSQIKKLAVKVFMFGGGQKG